MRRFRFAGLGAMVGVLALSPTGAAAPERNQVIRMGKGIGKIQLGMTLPQVRRAFRTPHAVVYRRVRFRGGGRYLELGWELPGRTSWEPVLWQVGFLSTSGRGPLRVTRVATDARSQRTPQGVGIGSRPRTIVRAYPHATCVQRPPWIPHVGAWIEVKGPDGGMTAFSVASRYSGPSPEPMSVVQVMVQHGWDLEAGGARAMWPGLGELVSG